MERTIKFRALLSNEYVMHMANPQKVWNYSGDFALSEEFSSNEMRGMPEFFAVMDAGQLDRGTLSQETGLVDANKRSIFEGDILDLNDGEVCGQVKFNVLDGAWSVVNETTEMLFRELVLSDWEIKGNIYENPELLAPKN